MFQEGIPPAQGTGTPTAVNQAMEDPLSLEPVSGKGNCMPLGASAKEATGSELPAHDTLAKKPSPTAPRVPVAVVKMAGARGGASPSPSAREPEAQPAVFARGRTTTRS